MRRYLSVITLFAMCSVIDCVGQQAVRGIPSTIDHIESNGRGIVCAMSDANRVYLSRDGGVNFVAIDTSDVITEPWIDNIWWRSFQNLVCIDSKNDYVWVRSQKGGILCRHNLATGTWSAPIPMEAPYVGPNWFTSCIATGPDKSVVVAIQGSSELLGEYNYLLKSNDAGDTWRKLPIMDSTLLERNPPVRSLVILPDGAVLALVTSSSDNLPGGVYRLALADSVWRPVFPNTDARALLLCGRSVYAWSYTSAWYSADLGGTFSPVNMNAVKNLSAGSYRGDTIAFVITDTATRSTRVVAVVNADVVDTIQHSIKHTHLSPFVGTISDSVHPKVMLSGNGVTGSLRRDDTVVSHSQFVPDTYLCHKMCRTSVGLAVYVEKQGIYRIDKNGVAFFDSAITYRLRRSPQNVWSSNEDGLILNIELNYVYCMAGRMDTFIRLNGPGTSRYPVLIHDSVVYAGSGEGIETFHLSDTANKRMISDGLPTFYGTTADASLGGIPLGYVRGKLFALAGDVEVKSPYTISPNGGVFNIVNEKWERANDAALGTFRLPLVFGDCMDRLCTFTSCNQFENFTEYSSQIFSFSELTNTVEQLSGLSSPLKFNRSTVVDESHVAMIGGDSHDTLRVVDVRTKRFSQAVVGIPRGVSTLNGKVAVSTIRDGILLYPLDALTSVSPPVETPVSDTRAWYKQSTQEIQIKLGVQAIGDATALVVDILGNTVASVKLGVHTSDFTFAIDVCGLARGCYIVVVKGANGHSSGTTVVVQ